jgi:hypothetical protein
MNPQESDEKVRVTCHGLDHDPFTCRVSHPDVPGEYCFPPVASLITGAARLMLALVEHCVSELGGTYAMEDTDSMAIVATKHGGMVACPGGSHRMKGGGDAVEALSWEQVEQISQRFAPLNPYSRAAVRGSVLKIEENNFDPKTGKQRQLYCFAISAKRYTLFLLDKRGEPVLLRRDINNNTDGWKQHGLGHLLNPTDLGSADRDWIGQVWLNMLRKAYRLSTRRVTFETIPAAGRVSVSSPAAMRPFSNFNAEKPYSHQIKPFNFVLTAYIKQLGHPAGVDLARFHLIAPYDGDSSRWTKTDWIDQYTGNVYRVTTQGHHGTREAARVKTYGETMREYEFHPEAKCSDANGNICGRATIGLLQRRHVQVDRIVYIGKESNRLEDVEAGTIHSAEEAYTEYCDPRRDEWQTKILPELRKLPLSFLTAESGLSRRMLIEVRAGRCRPHPKNQELLSSILRGLCEN